MTRGQRLAFALAAAAALLLLGRGTALLYVDRAWYASLGASTVWRERVSNTVLMHVVAIIAGTVFAYANIAAVRSSIIALIVPKRIGNVEIGEEIPTSHLIAIGGGTSLCAAIVASFTLPSWTIFSLWRSGVVFGEADPYFGADLGYYVSWLPLETATYVWAMVLFAIVTGIVLTLYSLTPSLRWGAGTVRVTTHARRHLSVLGAILVLFVAWGFRLDAFDTLIGGTHVFTYFDHKWLIPTDLTLSLIAVGAAVVLLVAGWMGQTTLALASVTAVLGCALISKVMLPGIGRYIASRPAYTNRETPYRATQALFTRRAFPDEPLPPSARFAADSAFLETAPRLQVHGGLPPIVYPHAQGVAVERDSASLIRAPRLGGQLQRVMSAWAEQNPRLLEAKLPSDAAFVRRRDLRDRVTAIAPIFAQSQTIGARPTPIGIVWILDLYTTSDRYPLSTVRVVRNVRTTYRHHAATAYVSGTTGGVVIVPDDTLDPIARAWFTKHPGRYLSGSVPRELSLSWSAVPSAGPALSTLPDSAFRPHILNIYTRMRAAFDAGDFHAFADAFDSLGAAVGARHTGAPGSLEPLSPVAPAPVP